MSFIDTIDQLKRELDILKRCSCKIQFFDTTSDFPTTGHENVIYVDKSTGSEYIWDGTTYITSSGGSSAPTEVTYSELVTLINSSGLTPFAYYKITDFQTVHYVVDASGTQHLDTIIIGSLEPLIIQALSSNTLDKLAKSSIHPEDIIHISFDENRWKKDYAFANQSSHTIIPGWKGTIYFRHDTLQDNYCGYDFRNVKHRRWKPSGIPTYDGGTTYSTGNIVFSGSGYFRSNVDNNLGNNVFSGYWKLLYFEPVGGEYVLPYNSIWGLSGTQYSDVLTFQPLPGGDYSAFKGVHIESSLDDNADYWLTATILYSNVFYGSSNEYPEVLFVHLNHRANGNTFTNYCYQITVETTNLWDSLFFNVQRVYINCDFKTNVISSVSKHSYLLPTDITNQFL